MRFDSVGLAGIVAVLWLGPSCGGRDTTSRTGAPASIAGGSENGGGRGAATGSGGVSGAAGSGGGHAGAKNTGGSKNTGGVSGDASMGGVSGADGSVDASAAGGVGGSGTGGNSSSGGGSSTGGASADASANLCGSEPCGSTRCAAWNCGAAVCCTLQSQPICVHGTTSCPASDGGGDSATLACWGGAKSAYVFGKSCTQKSDCFIADHWVGCCNVHAVGLNVSEQSRFDSFETSCGGAPPCGCCCDRVTAEDGTVVSSGTTLGVDCVAGLCKSTAP